MMLSKPAEMFGLQAKLFRGLSDHSRLAILETLRKGPAAVGEIAEKSGLSQSNTSNHLRCLSECGLVTSEQDGRFIYYRLSDQRIEMLLLLADDLLADKGRSLYECTNYQKPAIKRAERTRKRKNGPNDRKSPANKTGGRRRTKSKTLAK